MAIITLDQVIRQSERIKNYFENELNSGEIETIVGGAKFNYNYRNDEPPNILQGVDSAENILFSGKNVTVPASASTVTVCSDGFNDFNFNFESGIVSIASGVSNSSIMASGALTIYGNGGGNLYQADNSTILNYSANDTVFSSNDDALNAALSLGTAYYFLQNNIIKGEKKQDAVTDTVNDFNDLGVGDFINFQNSNGDLTNLMVTLNLYAQMKNLEETETYSSWEEIKIQNNETAANNRTVFTGGASYTSGNLYRTEVSWLSGNAFSSSKGNPSSTGVDQKQFDNLFIDFQGELNTNLSLNEDVDLKIESESGDWDYGDTLSENLQYSYRIHFPIMINSTYPIRTGKEPPDCLYAFIEQEPIIQAVTYSNGQTTTRESMSSVRQIIINNNVSSTARPLIFFYEGAEVPTKVNRPDLYDSDGDYIGARPFLPVILNLNKDFRGIVFAPNNPVCINGNGYKMEGFVVAREFRRLKTSTDFDNAVDSDNNKMYTTFTYCGKTAYGEISTMQDVTSSFPDSITIAGLTYVKTKAKRIVGRRTYWDDSYVQDGQWSDTYTSEVQIDINGDTTQYAYTSKLIYPATYDSKTYIITASSRFYVPVTSETVTYSSGTVLTQYLNKMYISGSAYTYTESYMNTSGKQKTKTSIMSIGDVQFVNINASDAAVDGNYTETPINQDTFADDDKLRYDYVNVFNLSSDSIYNSFDKLSIQNYTYLDSDSHDMFFTTARLKHID